MVWLQLCEKKELINNKETLTNGLLINQAPAQMCKQEDGWPFCVNSQIITKDGGFHKVKKVTGDGEGTDKEGCGRANTHEFPRRAMIGLSTVQEEPLRKTGEPAHILFSYRNYPQYHCCQLQVWSAGYCQILKWYLHRRTPWGQMPLNWKQVQ